MLSARCLCGHELVGATRDEQVAVAHEHFATAHPGLELSDTQIRNYLERSDQIAPVTSSGAGAETGDGEIAIVDLTADRVDDVLAFFDRHAFADNAAWASCYCMAHHVPGGEATPEWAERTWQRNRADLSARIGAGTTTGTLAYAGGRVVGWCNASPRSQFPDYAADAADGADDDRVGLVACFVIAAGYRGRGVASRLLAGAVGQFRRRRFTAVEARPAPQATTEAGNYHGPLSMYLAAGFAPAGPAAAPDSVVRLPLGTPQLPAGA
jgi:GNAT superfamily N-acetyltransferase